MSARVKSEAVPGAITYPTLRANLAWTTMGNVFNALAQWAVIVLLARLGNAAMVGQYALGLAIASPVFLLAGLNLRTVQATDVHQDFSFDEYLTVRLIGLGVAIGIVLLILCVSGFQLDTTLVVLAVSMTKAFESLSDVYYGLAHQQERMDQIAKSMILRGAAYVVVLSAVLRAGLSAAWGAAAMAVVAGVVSAGYDWKSGRPLLPSQWSGSNVRHIAKLAAPLGVIAMFVAVNSNIPRYFLAQVRSEHELGLFAALSYVSVAPNLLIVASGQAVSPRLARLAAFGDRRGLIAMAAKLILLAVVLGAACVFAVRFAGGILNALYGPEYAKEAALFQLITLAGALGLLASAMGYVLSCARCFAPQIPMFVAVSIVLAVACWRMTPAQGLWGAAQAQLWGVALQVVLSVALLASVIRSKGGVVA